SSHQRGVLKVSGAYSDIGVLLQQVDHTIRSRKLQFDLGETLDESGQRRHELVQRKCGYAVDAKPSAWPLARSRRLRLSVLYRGRNTPHSHRKVLAFRRQRKAPRRAMEQTDSESVFQPCDELGNSGWADSEVF